MDKMIYYGTYLKKWYRVEIIYINVTWPSLCVRNIHNTQNPALSLIFRMVYPFLVLPENG